MNLTIAIERNRQDLLCIVAMLLAAAGLVLGGSVSVLPRGVRNRVMRQLRSGEAALRRLLIVAALEMQVTLRPTRTGTSKASAKCEASNRERKPSFPLIESMPGTGETQRRTARGSGPSLSVFDGTDPAREAPAPEPSPNDLVDAKGLCRRLQAMQQVLENVAKHARRVALWQARRDAAAAKAASKPGRARPVRLGRPTGYRARRQHPVDTVLIECHALMLYALRPPDTG